MKRCFLVWLIQKSFGLPLRSLRPLRFRQL